MRKRSRTAAAPEQEGFDGADDLRYCVLCESDELFELVDADDRPSDGTPAAGEWICVRCGSAVFVDPPAQASRRTA
jgi:hypothetical protein